MEIEPLMRDPGPADCIVCLQLMAEPKSLRCGHSLCSGCADRLTQSADAPPYQKIRCPMCQKTTKFTPSSQLPTNYALKEFIDKVARNAHFQCSACKKPCSEIISCVDCEGMTNSLGICSSCVVKRHLTHSVDLVNAVLDNKDLDACIEKAKSSQIHFRKRCDQVRNEVLLAVKKVMDTHQSRVNHSVAAIETFQHQRAHSVPLLSKLSAEMELLNEVIEKGEKSVHLALNDIKSAMETHSKEGEKDKL